MNNVVDIKRYFKPKVPKKPREPFPVPWNMPRTVRNASREGLTLLGFAVAGVLASRYHFAILPELCALVCLVLVADLTHLAFRKEDNDSNDGSSPRDAA